MLDHEHEMEPILPLRNDIGLAVRPIFSAGMSRLGWVLFFWLLIAPAYAAEPSSTPGDSPAVSADSGLWHYGAYLDVAYILNFNFPEKPSLAKLRHGGAA